MQIKLTASPPRRAKQSVRTGAIVLALAAVCSGCAGLKLNPRNLDTRIVPLPKEFGAPISYDDFVYDAELNRVIVPAAETGEVALIDPNTLDVRLIGGFSRQTDSATPIVGTSSVAIAGGYLFGLDQHTQSIKTVDLSTGSVTASTPIQGAPDYIRYVSATRELWVTEKDLGQIEVFGMSTDIPPKLTASDPISIPNGPEALIIDDASGLAFTNRPKQALTDVIQVLTHHVIDHWGNGCSQARGMAVDDAEGLLFVACREGKIVVMDIHNHGFQVANVNYGAKLDFVAYNRQRHHVYLPSDASGIVAIFQLQIAVTTATPAGSNPAATGTPASPTTNVSLTWVGSADTAIGSKCVTADNDDNIWVCDPNNGRVFAIHDTLPDQAQLP